VCPHEKTLKLAAIATRLEKVDRTRQERLLNWGYAVCDAAMRRRVTGGAGPPPAWPVPALRLDQ
jgi:NTE family protein